MITRKDIEAVVESNGPYWMRPGSEEEGIYCEVYEFRTAEIARRVVAEFLKRYRGKNSICAREDPPNSRAWITASLNPETTRHGEVLLARESLKPMGYRLEIVPGRHLVFDLTASHISLPRDLNWCREHGMVS
jgi:hypothetical protein